MYPHLMMIQFICRVTSDVRLKRLSRIIDRTKFMSIYCKATLYQFKTRQLFIFPVVSSPNIPAMYLWQNYLNKRKDVKVVLYSIENHMIKVCLLLENNLHCTNNLL